MNNYRISNAELAAVAELKQNSGNVRLADLLPSISLEQVCMNLNDEQIEDLLHEKISNMDFYAHYNLSGRNIGWNFESCKNCVTARPVDTHYSMKMKRMLEQTNPRFRLIIDATRTESANKRWPYQDFMTAPKYGNVICYDSETGMFCAMADWIDIDKGAHNGDTSKNKANKFASRVINDANFRIAILQLLDKTL